MVGSKIVVGCTGVGCKQVFTAWFFRGSYNMIETLNRTSEDIEDECKRGSENGNICCPKYLELGPIESEVQIKNTRGRRR